MTLTRSRIIQYIGILLAFGLLAGGYWYFNAAAGVKRNAAATQPAGIGNLSSGLVAYFALDENTGTTAADSSTNTITALTLTNGPTWTTGQIGSGIDFDGTDDYATTADNDLLDFGATDDFTLTGWFNRDTFTTDDTLSAKSNGQTAADTGYTAYVDDTTDKVTFVVNDGADQYKLESTTTFTATGWHHYAIVWDQDSPANSEIYVDGAANGATDTGTIGNVDALANALAFRLGAESDNGNPFDGKLDEVRVYDRALAPDEIGNLYRLTTPTGVDTSLKGYWSMNAGDTTGTTAFDRSGSRNHATLVNTPTKAVGKVGQALSFISASSQYLNAGSAASLDDIANLSTCAWVKPNTSLTTYGDIATKFTNAGGGWQILLDYGTFSSLYLSFYRTFTGAPGQWLARTAVPYNQWSHVCVAYNNSSATNDPVFYVDGVLVLTYENLTPSGTAAGDSSGDMYIGAYNNGGSPNEFFDGQIEEPRVYNRIITAAEVRALYDAGAADKSNSSAVSAQGVGNLDSGLTGYWRLDEGTGTAAADSSTNAIASGTLTNGPTWGTGQIGSGVTFDGANDYIALTDDARLDFGDADDMTISGWFNRSTYTTGDVIVNKYDGVNPGYQLYIDDTYDKLTFQLNDGTDNYSVDAFGATFTSAGWHHFVAVWDQDSPANSEIYVDGVPTNATDSGTIGNIGTLTNSIAFSIGGDAGGSNQFAGSLDEIRVYDRALSAEEARNLYKLTTPSGVDTGLKGYWSMNATDTPSTTAYDRSGSRNTGTLTNGPTKGIGRLGQALNFDGTDDFITMGDPASGSLDFGTGSFSSSVWFKTSTTGTNMGIVTKKVDGTTGSAGWRLAIRPSDANRFQLITSDGTTQVETYAPLALVTDGLWHQGTIVIDRGTNLQYLYLDGVLLDSDFITAMTGSVSNTSDFMIGKETTLPFNGQIDEVRVYSRALSVAEVKAQYDIGAPDKVNTSASTPQGVGNPDSGLAAYWALDENTGTTTADSSTNAITALTLTNGPTWTTGQIGWSIDFDGTDDYATTADNNLLDFGDADNFTLTGWFNRDTFTTDDTVVAKRNGIVDTDDGYLCYISAADAFICEVSEAGGADEYSLTSTSTFTATGWHHFAFVWNQSTATSPKLYIDGVDNAATASGTVVSLGDLSNALAFRLGAESDNGNPFDGKLDEVRVYNRGLSADEIANLSRITTPTGVDTSLKGYWSMNAGDMSSTTAAYDRSGGGNTGTLTNGPTKTIGRLGQGLSFDGTDDYVDMGDINALDGVTAITVSAWVKTTSLATEKHIVDKSTCTGFDFGVFELFGGLTAAGKPEFYIYKNGGSPNGYSAASSVVINDGQWHLVTGTYDGAYVRIYVDGVESGQTAAASITLTSRADNVQIGGKCDTSPTAYPWSGGIDEVRLYNRALPTSEVAALYNSGR